MVKASLKGLFEGLQATMGVAGFEQETVKKVCAELKPYADSVDVTPTGNVIAVKKGHRPGKAVAVSAHMDEVGFIVRAILPSGFLLISKLGTIPENIMLARKVLVGKKRIPGVIGTRPGHLQMVGGQTEVKSVHDLYVDIAAFSREEVEGLGIRVGDPIIFDSDITYMANPDYLAARAVDDRMGCAAVIQLFKDLSPEQFSGTLYGVFTVREEVGLLGAPNAFHELPVDYAICIDTIPCGDTPEIDTVRQLPVYLGRGPVLPIANSVSFMLPGRVSIAHPAVRAMVCKQAEQKGLPLQQAVMMGAGYVTDATAVEYTGGGIPTATLAIPRRYSHAPVELVSLNDAAALVGLIEAVIEGHEKESLAFAE